MKKMRKVLWKKGFLSFVLTVSFLAGAIVPGGYARAAAPAAIPATLSLKEATGVCSGSATAFNVNSTSFESSKLKFYREMLDGVHEKNNASTKQNAPKATAAEDWFSVAYMLHQKRRKQSSTSNYNSRMEAMRYVTIAEYNNTNKISNNEYKNGYNWYIHRSGLNYSSSLSSANTDIRKKLYDYYLAQHTSSSNKKGWNSGSQSATNSFSALTDTTNRDVFWSVLSLNRTDGDKRRNGHGSALIAVFYDFKISPVLQEDKGTTYIRQRNDGSDRKDSFVSSITNNSPQNVNAEYTGSTENTVSHTSNINGSSSYTMGHSVTVGTNVNFGAFASGSIDYTFDYSNTVEKGWSKEESVSKTERKEDKSSISLPAYSAIMMKRTTSDSEEVTTYNCPVLLTYKVMLLEHILNASNDEAGADTATLGVFGSDSISAREDLKVYLTDNINIKDTNRNITWSELQSNSDTKNTFQYAKSNTALYIPMSSAGATYSVNLKTINVTYDGLISTQPLSKIETTAWDLNLLTGNSLTISNIRVKGINKAGTDYIGFNQDKGHWTITSADGKEDVSGNIASLSQSRSGKVTLNAHNPGTVYLEYVIDENCYATASAPMAYMTNRQLASTAILKVTIAAKKTAVPTPEATKLGSVKAAKRSIALTWKKITSKVQKKRIKGYQIQYSTKRSFKKAKTKNVNGYKKTRVTLKKLKAKKKYYIRVRTILKVNGKTYYSKWSKIKSVKTK